MPKYQVELRLRRLAAIQISKLLWRQMTFDLSTSRTEVWATISKRIDELSLPKALKEELRCIAGAMSMAIFNWLKLTAQREYNTSAELVCNLQHIQWTANGCIDQAETIRSIYRAGLFPEKTATLQRLSYHCLEDCVADLWPRLTKNIDCKDWHIAPLRFAFPYILPCYWNHHMDNRLDEFCANLKVVCDVMRYYDYDKTYSPNENLLIMSILAGNYSAVKYFWGLLDENQKRRSLIKTSESPICYRQIRDQWVGKDTEVIVFLLQKLTYYGVNDLVIIMLKSEYLLRKLLRWPWQDVFLQALEEAWKHHKNLDHTAIIVNIFTWHMKQQEISGIDNDYHRLFHEIWRRNPNDLKLKIRHVDVIEKLIEMKAMDGLHWIINDEDLKERRPKLLEYALWGFRTSMKTDYDVLNDFAAQVLVNDEERAWFIAEGDAIYKQRKIRAEMSRRHRMEERLRVRELFRRLRRRN